MNNYKGKIPKYNIGETIQTMFAQDNDTRCHCCGRGGKEPQKELTEGIIVGIRIDKHGISYGVDGLKETYPDTTYVINEDEIKAPLLDLTDTKIKTKGNFESIIKRANELGWNIHHSLKNDVKPTTKYLHFLPYKLIGIHPSKKVFKRCDGEEIYFSNDQFYKG